MGGERSDARTSTAEIQHSLSLAFRAAENANVPAPVHSSADSNMQHSQTTAALAQPRVRSTAKAFACMHAPPPTPVLFSQKG